MRIDQNLPIAESIQSERVSGTTTGQATSTAKTSDLSANGIASSDTSTDSSVSFSRQLQATLDGAPDIRQDKVVALQKAYQSGTYKVSSQDLAGALYNVMIQKSGK